MDILATLTDALWGLAAQFVSPHTSHHWLYFATSLALALWALNRQGTGRGTARRLLKRCFPGHLFLHRSARLDYRFFLANHFLSALATAPLAVMLLTSLAVSDRLWLLLAGLTGSEGLGWSGGTPVDAGMTVAVLLGADLGSFLAHYLLHRVGVLWEFHKVHHSAEVLTPATVHRVHPVEGLLNGLCAGCSVGCVYGVADFLYTDSPGIMQIMGTNALVFIFLAINQNLQHTHIWLSYGRLFNRIFISPAHHQIHHSRARRHYDRNFGKVFAFWDVLAGTLYAPDKREHLRFGVTGDDARAYNTISRLYGLPLVRVWQRLAAARLWQSHAIVHRLKQQRGQ